MNKLLLLFFLLSFNYITGQDLIEIRNVHTADKSEEVYHASPENENIKNGSYTYKDSTGKLILSGSYWMNQKDGLWTSYDSNDKVQYRGNYYHGTPVNEWEYFNSGKLIMKYNFSQNELVAIGIMDSTVNAYTLQVNGKDTIKTFTDHQATYIGGDYFLLDYIHANVTYPLYAQKNKIGGTVYIGVTIDSTGKAIDQRVLREIGGGCDQEAMRTVRLISSNWIPAVSNGKYITSMITIPVSFRLNK